MVKKTIKLLITFLKVQMRHYFQIFKSNYSFSNYLVSQQFEIEMDMPFRIKRNFFYFKLNVIVKIRLLAKFDYCITKFSESELFTDDTSER